MPGTALETGYNTPRKKIHLGRKEGKMLKKNPLTAWNQKVGMDRKSLKKLKLSAELVKFYEVFLVDKNSSFNNPLKEKNLSHQHVWLKVGAELPPFSRRVSSE